ncbi:hypothetical protein [Bacillus pinisoli]|uniref:hypothetical protein n=1 Tax=Bacillus pinisoli TaxID=2901866 RepID=UPI001FF2DC60|nr:hypothetical protein [Bacillus pinisoli]
MVILLTFVQLLVIFHTYYSLSQRKELFDDRFGKNYTFASTGVSSFFLAMMLIFLIPGTSFMVIAAVIVGVLLGALFGSLYKMQTILLGIWNGGIGGLMGSMLGLVVLDPSLCGLPGTAARDIANNIILFSIFGTIILFTTMWLVRFSLRV